MTLSGRLAESVRACFTGLWVRSAEPDDAVSEITALCRREGWALATWDVDRGLAAPGEQVSAPDSLAAIRALAAMATPDGTAILVLRNFHRFLGSPEVVQALDTRNAEGRRDRTFVVILSPVIALPSNTNGSSL